MVRLKTGSASLLSRSLPGFVLWKHPQHSHLVFNHEMMINTSIRSSSAIARDFCKVLAGLNHWMVLSTSKQVLETRCWHPSWAPDLAHSSGMMQKSWLGWSHSSPVLHLNQLAVLWVSSELMCQRCFQIQTSLWRMRLHNTLQDPDSYSNDLLPAFFRLKI